MARPTLPLDGATGYGDQLRTAINTVSDTADSAHTRIDSLASNPGASSIPGLAFFDSFSGATDDAKLTNAMTILKADTYKRSLVMGNRRHVFTQANRILYPGFSMIGLGAVGDQGTGQNEVPNKIEYDGTGVWFVVPNDAGSATRGCKFQGLFIEGNSSSQFMSASGGTGGGIAGKFTMRDLGFNLWKNVLGNPAQKWLSIACLFDGWWNVNNGYDTAFTMGGSDSNFWTDGMLLDSPPTIMAANSFHLIWDFQEKSSVGPIYCTAERSSGVRVLGGSTTAGMVMYGAGRVEGRNTNTPCSSACIRIDGGNVTIRDWWVSYGGTAFNSTGHTGEAGIIQQTGGNVHYDGLYYDRAAAVAENVKFISVSGGTARIRNIRTGAKGGAWVGLPRVGVTGSGVIDADNSVTVV